MAKICRGPNCFESIRMERVAVVFQQTHRFKESPFLNSLKANFSDESQLKQSAKASFSSESDLFESKIETQVIAKTKRVNQCQHSLMSQTTLNGLSTCDSWIPKQTLTVKRFSEDDAQRSSSA